MDAKGKLRRRELLLGAGRWLTGVLAVGGVAWLTARPGSRCAPGQECRQCPSLDTCREPRAEKARSAPVGER